MTPENSTNAQTAARSELRFGSFCLVAAKRLWCGDQPVILRPRSLAMLRYLAERPGRLVTKEELLKQLWPGIYVSSTVIKVCVREIRHALGDDAAKPQFIETVDTQGYRFISSVAATPPVQDAKFKVGGLAEAEPTPSPQHPTPNFVGRDYELAQLQHWYECVQQGKRQIIFVSGEAGIGKTTLVEHFLAQATAGGTVRIGRGYCVEQDEQGEEYLPILQALQQLSHAPDCDQTVAILRRYAPFWLAQLSGLIDAKELARLQHQLQGSSPRRMLREFGETIERLTAETPVILFLEELQWSDGATLELLAYLAQRQERARLLVLAAYRPSDTVLSGHPLRQVVQKLIGRGQCQELTLELLNKAEVETYLTQRLGESSLIATLSSAIHRRTDGNPLFMKHFVDYLIQKNLLVKTEEQWELQVEPTVIEELIPNHVHQLIAKQIEGLNGEMQQLLEIASIVGMNFTAREVAEVVNRPLEATEAVYDEVANQGQFLEVQGLANWPDGSLTVRYHFRHVLYRDALYHRIGLAQRVRWHRQLGEHFARACGEHIQEMAGELAFHFEHGWDYQRAVSYRLQAGEQALQQNAYQKALGHGHIGLALLPQLPTTKERDQLELRLCQLVNMALAIAEEETGPTEVSRDLQLIHRRVGHERPGRSHGVVGRVGEKARKRAAALFLSPSRLRSVF